MLDLLLSGCLRSSPRRTHRPPPLAAAIVPARRLAVESSTWATLKTVKARSMEICRSSSSASSFFT